MEQLTTVVMVFGAAVASLALSLVALTGVKGTCSASCQVFGARCDLCPGGERADDDPEVGG